MYKRLATIAIGALSVPVLGLATIGIAHAVSPTPSPRAVVPVSILTSKGGADDPANHEINDDRGAAYAADHDADDNVAPPTAPVTTRAPTAPSVASVTTRTTLADSDEGPGHDLFDDHGARSMTGATTVTNSQSGHDDSRSSSSGSSGRDSGGRDDGTGHA